jgi:hypothetical protein
MIIKEDTRQHPALSRLFLQRFVLRVALLSRFFISRFFTWKSLKSLLALRVLSVAALLVVSRCTKTTK